MLGYLAVAIASHTAASPPPSAVLTNSEAPLDGTDPPHAVDIAGKPIPQSSTTMPDKPIILGKDSKSRSRAELKPEAAFDHTKHATDVGYSIDGKAATACVVCHHTEQPSAPKGKEYLRRFERKEVLTAEQLAASQQPVRSCRACHFQEATAATNEFPPPFPKEMGREPAERVTNQEAYHINCIGCHEAVAKGNPKSKAPTDETGCGSCHSKKT